MNSRGHAANYKNGLLQGKKYIVVSSLQILKLTLTHHSASMSIHTTHNAPSLRGGHNVQCVAKQYMVAWLRRVCEYEYAQDSQKKSKKKMRDKESARKEIRKHKFNNDKMNRFKDHYNDIVCYDLLFKDMYTNVMQTPKLNKIVLNAGVGKRATVERSKAVISALLGLEIISQQKCTITRAKKSIDKYKLREKMPIGCKVTLRKKRKYLFLDRLNNQVLCKSGLEEFTDLVRKEHFLKRNNIDHINHGLQVYITKMREALRDAKRSDDVVYKYDNFKFIPTSIKDNFFSKLSTLPFGISQNLAQQQPFVNKFYTVSFGLNDFLAFREMEQHYDKFDGAATSGLDINIVLDTKRSSTRQKSNTTRRKIPINNKPVYLLSSFQLPLF